MTPLYIFDLDGTLALTEHRQHLLGADPCQFCGGSGLLFDVGSCPACSRTENKKTDWDAFFAACVDDTPNLPVINTLHNLVRAGAEIRIWSGRSSVVMAQTLEWLSKQVGVGSIVVNMRPEGDHRPDEELKQSWLLALPPVDLRRLVAVFDDRDKVVRMWRANGVACFQVAPGEF